MFQYGIVEDINDPLQLGRVKVRVYGAHTLTNGSGRYNIDTKDLGWSNVVLSTNTPAINGLGHSVNLIERTYYKKDDLLPEVFIDRFGHEQYYVTTETVPAIGDEKSTGSLVCGIFLDAAQQEFLVVGTLPTKSHGKEDNNDRVRGVEGVESLDVKGKYEPRSAYAPEYPYNNVYETISGHVKEYDDTPGHERIKERHMSGTQYEIQPDGSKIEKIVRDNYTLIVGHNSVEIKGHVRIFCSGDTNLVVATNCTTQVGGHMKAYVDGNMGAFVDGNADLLIKGDIDGEVRGNIDIDVGPSDPEHVIYNDDGVAVHHVVLGGYTRNKAIEQWFPPQKTDTFTLTHKNMRKVKELSAEAQEPYAAALATFDDYDPDKVKLVDGQWTYPDKESLTASFGNIELHTEGGLNAIVGGEVDMTVFQNAKLDIRKNADIDIGGNVDMDVVGNIVIDATGDESIIDINSIGDSSQIDVNSAGTLKLFSTGTTDVESTGDMTLKSTNIKLDGNVVVTGTTRTSNTQLIDGHTHTQPNTTADQTVQGNTGALS